jgi:methylated-DNA-[protein]-cysteine S-methyltransferase
MKRYISYDQSPIGWLRTVGTEKNIVELKFSKTPGKSDRHLPKCIQTCKKQLQEYFQGRRKKFSLPLELAGTDFQKSVWRELASIPYGQAVSYGDIACRVGNPKSSRAVGGANHVNPIVIVIPCHRVIGSNGHLMGFGGAVWRKQWLLRHERAVFREGDTQIRYAQSLPEDSD